MERKRDGEGGRGEKERELETDSIILYRVCDAVCVSPVLLPRWGRSDVHIYVYHGTIVFCSCARYHLNRYIEN